MSEAKERRPQISFPVDQHWKEALNTYIFKRSMEEGRKVGYAELIEEAFGEMYGIDFSGKKKKMKMKKLIQE